MQCVWHKGQLSLTLTWLWIDYWNRQGGKWNYFTSKCFYPGSRNDSQTCYILLQMSRLHLSVSTIFHIRFITDWDIKDGLNLFRRTQMLSRVLCFTHWNAWRLPESFIFISLLFPSIDAELGWAPIEPEASFMCVKCGRRSSDLISGPAVVVRVSFAHLSRISALF